MSISDRFKKIRKHFGLSQAQFAERIRKSPGFISNVETDRSEISPSTIQDICSVFGINESWLVSGTGEMFPEGGEVGEADKDNAGARIKLIRKGASLTQEQFAAKIGYSKMQIHSVESGKTVPSNEFLKCVASAFDVNYEWLLTGVGKMEAESAVLDDSLIEWLRQNPEVIRELRSRSGLK